MMRHPSCDAARRKADELNDGYVLPFDLGQLPNDPDRPERLLLSFAVSKSHLSASRSSEVGREPRVLCFLNPQKLELSFRATPLYIGKWGANPRGPDALIDSRSRCLGALRFMCTKQPMLVTIATLEVRARAAAAAFH